MLQLALLCSRLSFYILYCTRRVEDVTLGLTTKMTDRKAGTHPGIGRGEEVHIPRRPVGGGLQYSTLLLVLWKWSTLE